jgi:hypothetical protein
MWQQFKKNVVLQKLKASLVDGASALTKEVEMDSAFRNITVRLDFS